MMNSLLRCEGREEKEKQEENALRVTSYVLRVEGFIIRVDLCPPGQPFGRVNLWLVKRSLK